MLINDYQEAVKETVYSERPGLNPLIYPTLGLTGEAGEVSDLVKKMLRDDDGQLSLLRRDDLIEELGDVLWYVSRIAEVIGTELSLIAARSLMKTKARAEANRTTTQPNFS